MARTSTTRAAAAWLGPLALLAASAALVSSGACLADVTDYCYVGVDCAGDGGNAGVGGAGVGGAGTAGAGGEAPCNGQPEPEPSCAVATCACPQTSIPLSPDELPHCYGLLDDQAWPQPAGAAQIEALAVADNDDILLVGRYSGSFDLGSVSPVVDAGSGDDELWVGRVTADLQPLWHVGSSSLASSARFGTSGTGARAQIALAFDPDSQSQTAVVFTSVEGDHTLNSTQVNAPLARNCVFIRLDGDGNVMNRLSLFPGPGNRCDGNAITANGDALYVAGEFRGHISFSPAAPSAASGCDMLTTVGDDDDGFVIKLDHTLQPQWCRRFGAGQSDDAYAVAGTADGGVVVGGDFRGSLQLGGKTLTAAGADALVLAYDAAGEVRWAQAWGDAPGGSQEQFASALIAVDDAIFVAGGHQGDIDIAGTRYAGSVGQRDVAVLRLDLDGAVGWSRVFRGQNDDDIYRLAADAVSIHLVGTVTGDIDLHQQPPILQAAAEDDDGMVVSLDQQCGHTIAARVFPGEKDQKMRGLGMLSSGALVVSMTYDGNAQWTASTPLNHVTSGDDVGLGLFQP